MFALSTARLRLQQLKSGCGAGSRGEGGAKAAGPGGGGQGLQAGAAQASHPGSGGQAPGPHAMQGCRVCHVTSSLPASPPLHNVLEACNLSAILLMRPLANREASSGAAPSLACQGCRVAPPAR